MRHLQMLLSGVAVIAIACGCSKDSEAAPAPISSGASSVTTSASGGVVAVSASGGGVPGVSVAPGGTNHVDGKNYKIDMALTTDCHAGEECKEEIKLQAAGDFHINKEYPYKFKADTTAVTFTGTDAGGPNVFSKAAGDFRIDDEKRATMTVKFKASAAGTVHITGSYKMSVCSKDQCQLETQALDGTFIVK